MASRNNYQNKFILNINGTQENVFKFKNGMTDLYKDITIKIYKTKEEENDLWVFIEILFGSIPINRQYFTKIGCKGYKLLESLQIQLLDQIQIQLQDKWIDNISNMIGQDSESIEFITQLSDKKKKLLKFEKLEQHSTMKLKEKVKYEFQKLVTTGKISTYKEFRLMYKDDPVKYGCIAQLEKSLTPLIQIFREDFGLKANYIDPVANLIAYCEKNPISKDEQLTVAALKEYHLLEMVTALFNVGILKQYKKKRGVWFISVTNCGKSEFIKMLIEIFYCDKLIAGQSHFSVGRATLRQLPNFVLMDDLEINKFINKNNINTFKRFLEGEGFPVETKFGTTDLAFEQCTVVAASNKQPQDIPGICQADFDALNQRIEFVYLDSAYQKTQDDVYPVKAKQLAHFLLELHEFKLDTGKYDWESFETYQQNKINETLIQMDIENMFSQDTVILDPQQSPQQNETQLPNDNKIQSPQKRKFSPINIDDYEVVDDDSDYETQKKVKVNQEIMEQQKYTVIIEKLPENIIKNYQILLCFKQQLIPDCYPPVIIF